MVLVGKAMFLTGQIPLVERGRGGISAVTYKFRAGPVKTGREARPRQDPPAATTSSDPLTLIKSHIQSQSEGHGGNH